MAWSLAATFRSAAARPGGYRVSMAPSASARYSRRRDTANLMICAMIGASTSSTTPIAKKMISRPPPPRSLPRRPPIPPHQNHRRKNSLISTTVPTSVATTVPTRMSRSRTWLSSWATTPSSSTRFIMSSRPWVTAIDECSGSRPVANAFGACSGTTYTRGLGIPAARHSPSTTLCKRGSSWGVTSMARVDASTTRSP